MLLTIVVFVMNAKSFKVNEAPRHESDLKGSWAVVSFASGEGDFFSKLLADSAKEFEVEFTDDQLTLSGGKKPGVSVKYTLDPEKDPKWIDFIDGKRNYYGIYRVDGDELTICSSVNTQGKRPTEFKIIAGKDAQWIMVLKRRKEEDNK